MGIYVGLGANLFTEAHGSPRRTLEAALRELGRLDIETVAVSRWYESAPVPASDQPWYVNAVAEVRTGLSPAAMLAALHRVEADFGRVRGAVNAARAIDLDIVDYEGRVEGGLAGPVLPHPRMHERAFVLLPLRDLAPGWRHPVTGESIGALIDRLDPGQQIRLME